MRFKSSYGRTAAAFVILLGVPVPLSAQSSPAAAPSGDVRSQSPLRLDDLLGILEFTDRTPPALSPDGALVAFTLRDPRRAASEEERGAYFDEGGVPRHARAADIHLSCVATGATRRLTGGFGSSWGPVWSPDGSRFVFHSDRDGLARVWMWDRAREEVTRVASEVVRPYWGFEQMQWSPDGRRLLVKLLPQGATIADLAPLLPVRPDDADTDTGAAEGPAVRRYVHSPAPDTAAEPTRPAMPPVDLDSTRSFLNVQLGDLAIIEVATGEVRRIVHRVRAMGYRFSPAGDHVAFTTRQPDGGTGMLVYNRYDLWVVGLEGQPPRLLAPRTVQEYGMSFAWSPEGTRLAFVSDDDIHVIDAASGDTVRSFTRAGVSFRHPYRPPLWTSNDALLVAAADTVWRLEVGSGTIRPAATTGELRLLSVVSAANAQTVDGRRLDVTVMDPRTKRRGFQRLDLETGTATTLHDAAATLGSMHHLAPSADGRTLVFVAGEATRPPDLWVAEADFERVRRLTDLHPTISRLQLGESRLVEWTDGLGQTRQGALLLPAGYQSGGRYPLVVHVYGGATPSAQVNRFGVEPGIFNMHLLASRGYAVLLPDAPLRLGSPLADLAATVLPGIDAVVDMGVADPDRVAVMGHSYGGYSALALAVQSTGFRAVISSAGFSNLLTQYTRLREDGSAIGIGWSERGQGKMGGHPWEQWDRYRENSPFFHLDRINAPVLLLHGGSDPTVAPQASRETFVALRRLDKPVELVEYEGEGHSPLTWRVENVRDYWQRVFTWLDTHVAPRDAL